ncbi:MAG: chorismate mutase, partial [Firmicutes bacterium]|nr:chorismate mutase [Bacillota bacterium]
MNREDIREKIDAIDDELCDLFSKRMDLALSMAKYKKENGLAVLDQDRENQVLHRISDRLGEPLDRYGRILFNTMFDVSRAYQHSCMDKNSELKARIKQAVENT